MTIEGNGLSIDRRPVYSNGLRNASISIIGYQDICSMRRKLFRPEEIMIGCSARGRGHITHLAWQSKDDFYEPVFHSEVPASVCSFLPISGDFDYEWPRRMVNSSALVAGASDQDIGLWLFNFSARFSMRLIGSEALMPYINKGFFPHLSFGVDHENKLISLLIHENLGSKQVMPYIKKEDGTLFDSRVLAGRIDLNEILIKLGTDFEKTFATSLRFITQSK